VGWGSVESNGIFQKSIFLMQENRFVQGYVKHDLRFFHRKERLPTLHEAVFLHEKYGFLENTVGLLYIACQLIGVAACVAISQTIAAIGMLFNAFLRQLFVQ
jgi:hypothetical protein